MNVFLSVFEIISSFVLSFVLSGFFIKRLSDDELKKYEEEEKLYYKNMFKFKYLELLKEEPSYNIEPDEDKYVEMDVPNNRVRVYYKDGAFNYYTEKGDILYKYVNVACRLFVINHKCKHLYKDDDIIDEEENKNVDNEDKKKGNNLFLKNRKSNLKKDSIKIEKKINKCIWKGYIHDIKSDKVVKLNDDNKSISFQEYLSLKKTL